jgi:hypothetical protein
MSQADTLRSSSEIERDKTQRQDYEDKYWRHHYNEPNEEENNGRRHIDAFRNCFAYCVPKA